MDSPLAVTAENDGILGQSLITGHVTHGTHDTAVTQARFTAHVTLRLENIVVAHFNGLRIGADLEDVIIADDHDAHITGRTSVTRVGEAVYNLNLFLDKVILADNDRAGFGDDTSFGMNDSARADRNVPA